jgi:hypothetical protein
LTKALYNIKIYEGAKEGRSEGAKERRIAGARKK